MLVVIVHGNVRSIKSKTVRHVPLLLLGQELGFLQVGDEGKVGDNSDDQSQQTFDDEDPSPARVGSDFDSGKSVSEQTTDTSSDGGGAEEDANSDLDESSWVKEGQEGSDTGEKT